jgi:hypothetical protein
MDLATSEPVSLGSFDLLGGTMQEVVEVDGYEAEATEVGATSLGTFDLGQPAQESFDFKGARYATAPAEAYSHDTSAEPPIVVPCAALGPNQC